MRIISTPVVDCHLIELDRFDDARGHFFELFQQKRYGELAQTWIQASCSVSRKNVVRGLHVAPYAKLVTCLRGRVFDVVADVRESSPTFLRWYGAELSAAELNQVYVPPHCAHAFMALEPDSQIVYLQSGLYNPATESSIHWRDPRLAIAWPEAEEYILSPRDQEAPHLSIKARA